MTLEICADIFWKQLVHNWRCGQYFIKVIMYRS